MLIEYEKSRDPVIVYNDQIFVQNQQKDHIGFHPDRLIFLTLSSPQLGQLTSKDLFVKHEKMTLDYQAYKKLKAEKAQILPLLRKALTDPSLPDTNYCPFGKYSDNSEISSTNLSPYAGKVEFLSRIGRLKDHKAIPELREVLFNRDDTWNHDNMLQSKSGANIKDECIRVLGLLGARSIIFEYLEQQKTPSHRHIQAGLTSLMANGLTDADLPRLMKLCEKYESLDQEAYSLDRLYLNKLFYEGYAGGYLRGQEGYGVLDDRDEDAPVQRLLCKAIARIGTQKSVEMLEDIFQHAFYREMNRSALTGIRHRAFLKKHNLRHQISKTGPLLVERIFREYCNFDNRDMQFKHMPHAWTYEAEFREEERRRGLRKQEKIDEKQRLAKQAEYLQTLQPGDKVHIDLPINYNDKECTGTVIENNGEILVIESQFENKKKIGRRKFRIKNGQSTGPACFFDEDGRGNKPYFYTLFKPKPKEEYKRNISEPIKIPIIKQREDPRPSGNSDSTNELVF